MVSGLLDMDQETKLVKIAAGWDWRSAEYSSITYKYIDNEEKDEIRRNMVQSIGNRAGFEHSYFEILQVSKCLDGLNWLNDNYCFMILN